MSKLLDAQMEFTQAICKLTLMAKALGYEVTDGDCYRDPRCNYGSKSSKHKRRLARDLNLFKDGKYMTKTADHKPLGKLWERMGGIWGGRFGDGNHYEWPL